MGHNGFIVKNPNAGDLVQTPHLRGDSYRFSIPILLTVVVPFAALAVCYHLVQGLHHSHAISDMLQLLLLLYIASSMTSCLFYLLGLPYMLGAFLTGLILRHCIHVVIFQTSNDGILSMTRSISVAVLCLYVSVSMDFFTLRRIKRTVVALSTLPFLFELLLVTTAIYWLKHPHFSFSSCFITGSTLNVISAPIVLTMAAYYHTHMYPVQRRTLCVIVVAACLEEILSTTILLLTRQYHISIESKSGITAGIIELIQSLLYGPIGAVFGMAFAYVWAYSSLMVIQCRRKFSLKPVYCQSIHLTSGAVILVLIACIFNLPLAITSGCLVLGFLVSSAWKDDNENTDVLRNTLMLVWTVLCPLYFGLLGNQLPIEVFDIQPQVVTKCVAMVLLLVGFLSRVSVTVLITWLARWPENDCLFAGFALLPKTFIPMNITQYALLMSLTDAAVLIMTPLSVLFHLLSTTVSVYMTAMVGRITLKQTVNHSTCVSAQLISNEKNIPGLMYSHTGLINGDLC